MFASDNEESVINVFCLLTNIIYDADSEFAEKLIMHNNLFQAVLDFLNKPSFTINIFENLTIFLSLAVKKCGKKIQFEVVSFTILSYYK